MIIGLYRALLRGAHMPTVYTWRRTSSGFLTVRDLIMWTTCYSNIILLLLISTADRRWTKDGVPRYSRTDKTRARKGEGSASLWAIPTHKQCI